MAVDSRYGDLSPRGTVCYLRRSSVKILQSKGRDVFCWFRNSFEASSGFFGQCHSNEGMAQPLPKV